MTEPTPTIDDAPWLTEALRDIAETAPVGEAPVLGDQVPAVARGRDSRRLLAVAAIVVLLVALAAGVLIAGNDDGDTGPASIQAGDPTGFYVPKDLPAGWRVDDVSLVQDSRPCPCVQRTWMDPSNGSWIGFSSDPASSYTPIGDGGGSAGLGGGAVGEMQDDQVEQVDLGAGVEGELMQGSPTAFQITWIEGDRARTVSANGLSKDEVIAQARTLVGQPDPESSPAVKGWELAYERVVDESSAPSTLVIVTVETEAGHAARYLLLPSGEVGVFVPGFRPTARKVPGQPLPMEELRPAVGRRRSIWPLIGRWPGSDVYVDMAGGPEQATQEEIDALAGSLRPATAEEWRQFAADAGNSDPKLTSADSFDDVVGG